MLTDKEMIRQALYYYASERRNFVGVIAQKSYRKRDGTQPTKEDIDQAIKCANRAERLYSLAKDDLLCTIL